MLRKILITTLLTVSLLVVMTPAVFAGDPEPVDTANEHLVGPAFVAQLVMVESQDGTVSATFKGKCKNNELVFSDNFMLDQSISNLTPDDLVDLRLGSGYEIAPECYSDVLSQLIINAVHSFNNMGTTVTAKVIVMAVVPK